MESFYPNNWGQPDNPTEPAPLTTRASLAELDKWDGFEISAADVRQAKQVEVADRARWEAGHAAVDAAFTRVNK